MHFLVQDVRFALRTLRKNAWLTLLIVSRAIGIGTDTALKSFSRANSTLIQL
jgi:hypothetical protein